MTDTTWQPVTVRLADLTPWERNPKHISKAHATRLLDLWQRIGQFQTISIGPNGEVYDGHQRLSVLKAKHGTGYEVQALQSSRALTEKEREELTVAAHVGTVGQFDWDALSGWDADNLQQWGFDAETLTNWQTDIGALGAMLASEEEPPQDDPGAQIDRAEELQAKWGTATGQMWLLDSGNGYEHRLICGDCTDAAAVARVMGGERAALAWFDPPFGIDLVPQRGLTAIIEGDGNAAARVLWAKFLPILADNMRPDTNVFLCQDWTEFEWTLPLVRQYFTVKSKVVWNKNVWGIGYYTRPKHEDILYCWNGNPPTIAEPVADVWDVARESAPDHAAEKPPELSGIAIGHFSCNGDIVADWFCGVGGSIIACERLGRRCRAVEISPAYCAVAIQRWHVMTGGEPVLLP